MNDDAIKADKMKYTAVFAITTLIFVIGFFLGSYASGVKVDKLNGLEQDLRSNTLALELQYEIVSENPCDAINSTILTEELYELGSKLEHMESALGLDDPGVVRLKDYYAILQLRNWLLMKKINKECNAELKTIMFFYSNTKDCELCGKQVYVLTFLRKKYPEIKTYTFDINIDNPAINAVKTLYIKNSTLPALIIEGESHYGFKDANAITELVFANETITS